MYLTSPRSETVKCRVFLNIQDGYSVPMHSTIHTHYRVLNVLTEWLQFESSILVIPSHAKDFYSMHKYSEWALFWVGLSTPFSQLVGPCSLPGKSTESMYLESAGDDCCVCACVCVSVRERAHISVTSLAKVAHTFSVSCYQPIICHVAYGSVIRISPWAWTLLPCPLSTHSFPIFQFWSISSISSAAVHAFALTPKQGHTSVCKQTMIVSYIGVQVQLVKIYLQCSANNIQLRNSKEEMSA